jgi:hypothetical protein
VFNWRKGKIDPSLPSIGKIATALGIHKWQLLHDPEETTPAPAKVRDSRLEALQELAGEEYEVRRRRKSKSDA